LTLRELSSVFELTVFTYLPVPFKIYLAADERAPRLLGGCERVENNPATAMLNGVGNWVFVRSHFSVGRRA
jgi:hypothetical protein